MTEQNFYTVLEGGHETVAETAKVLADAGRTVKVRDYNTTEYVPEGADLAHLEGRSVFEVDGKVQATIRDQSHVTVRHDA